MWLQQLKALNGLLTEAVRRNLRLGAAEAPKYINHVKQEIIYKKVGELNRWYNKALLLDEVRQYQDRVVALQEKLLSVQDRRRHIGQELIHIRGKSNELQDHIHKVKRQEDLQRFLDLMKEETEILKMERQVTNSFNECDREEREVFTAFTNAVRDSHEKQRAQVEYTKYFGLILSLVGSLMAFCYSTLRKHDLKNFIEEHMLVVTGSSRPLLVQLEENQHQLSRVVRYIDGKNPEFINLINRNHRETMNAVRNSHGTNRFSSLFQTVPVNNSMSDAEIGQKIVLYSCVAVVALLILRAFS